MSDTPRTEAEVNRQKCWSDDLVTIDANFACQLERELNSANDRIKRLEDDLMDTKNQYAVLVADVVLYEDIGEHIKRLEEAGDALLRDNDDMANINQWLKAKEAKP